MFQTLKTNKEMEYSDIKSQLIFDPKHKDTFCDYSPLISFIL